MAEIYSTAVDLYRAAGWPSVLPTSGKVLIPEGVTGRRGRMPTPEDYLEWLGEYAGKNASLRLPKWVIGIDVDAYEGKQGGATLLDWEGRLGPLPATVRSSARIGDNLSGIRFFKVPAEGELRTDLGHDSGIEVVQFHHRYAVVWPSIHPDLGSKYQWFSAAGRRMDRVPQPTEVAELPPAWYDALRQGAPLTGDLRRAPRGSSGARSTLSKLLATPPAEGGRNNWLARVAGHLAKGKFHEDGFIELLSTINRSLANPLDDSEVQKAARSIWRTEQEAKTADGEMPTQATGWLASGGDHLLCQVEVGEKDAKDRLIVPCSDFDLRVLGKYTDEDHSTYYRLQVESGLQPARYVIEPAALFGNARALAPRLRALELNCWPVKGDLGAVQSRNPAGRLGHYLSVQEAPRLQVAPQMGWSDVAEGFVCDEGVITAEGLDPQGGWMPDPAIRRRDPMVNQYGFEGTWEDAQRVLKEVLTYQDDVVCSVFGAWWAACLVKAQIMGLSSLFPFMAIEAMSGTGKSEGFFSLMVRLNGATKLGSQQTAASFRDSMAANRSGIVWIDDLDDATRVYQDIRTATNESYRSKKGMDHFGSVSVRLVAPVLLTGEALPGLADQTALLDRLIRLDVPPAKDRRSKKGDYPQWDDIQDLQSRHPEMWRIAGWYVQKALHFWPHVAGEWKRVRTSSGRHADKMATLRMGARLLDLMTDDGWHTEVVDDWCGRQAAPEGDYLTNRILPELLRDSRMIGSALDWQPVWVDENGIVWWHPGRVADVWAKKYRTADQRTKGFASPDTLARHREAMGVTKADRRKFSVHRVGDRRNQQNYYPVPADISKRVLGMAEG